MKRILALGLAALLATQILAACSFSEDLQTYPLPTAAISWDPATQMALRTAPCPATELPSVVVEWDVVHRSLSLSGLKVDLPFGFTGRILPSGRYQIVAPGGAVVAQDGDTIKLGGADTEHVCRVQGVEY